MPVSTASSCQLLTADMLSMVSEREHDGLNCGSNILVVPPRTFAGEAAMNALAISDSERGYSPVRTLCCPTLRDWRRVFPNRDLGQDPTHTLITYVECGALLVGLTRDKQKIERLNLQTICKRCAQLPVAA